jgi:hypothetical protein
VLIQLALTQQSDESRDRPPLQGLHALRLPLVSIIETALLLLLLLRSLSLF